MHTYTQARWQLAVLQLALADRGVGAARQTRKRIEQEMGAFGRQHAHKHGDGDVHDGSDEEENLDAGVGTEDADSETGIFVSRSAGSVGNKDNRFAGNVSIEKALGRRRRYGQFLPLPGQATAPSKATLWDSEDVSGLECVSILACAQVSLLI